MENSKLSIWTKYFLALSCLKSVLHCDLSLQKLILPILQEDITTYCPGGQKLSNFKCPHCCRVLLPRIDVKKEQLKLLNSCNKQNNQCNRSANLICPSSSSASDTSTSDSNDLFDISYPNLKPCLPTRKKKTHGTSRRITVESSDEEFTPRIGFEGNQDKCEFCPFKTPRVESLLNHQESCRIVCVNCSRILWGVDMFLLHKKLCNVKCLDVKPSKSDGATPIFQPKLKKATTMKSYLSQINSTPKLTTTIASSKAKSALHRGKPICKKPAGKLPTFSFFVPGTTVKHFPNRKHYKFVCQFCKFRAASSDSVLAHQNTCMVECPDCHVTFTGVELFEKHKEACTLEQSRPETPLAEKLCYPCTGEPFQWILPTTHYSDDDLMQDESSPVMDAPDVMDAHDEMDAPDKMNATDVMDATDLMGALDVIECPSAQLFGCLGFNH